MDEKIKTFSLDREKFSNFLFLSGKTDVSPELLRAFMGMRLESWKEYIPELISREKSLKEVYEKLSGFSLKLKTTNDIKLFPSVPDTLFDTGFSKLEGFFFWELISEYWQIEKKKSTLKRLRVDIRNDVDEKRKVLLDEIEGHLDKCQFEAAFPLLMACVEKNIPDFTLLVSLANIYMYRENFEKSEECLNKAKEIAQKRSSPYYVAIILSQIAFISHLRGKTAQAYFRICEAEENNPDIPGIDYYKALYCLTMEDEEQGGILLSKAIEKDMFYCVRLFYDPSFKPFENIVKKVIRERSEIEHKRLDGNFKETMLAFQSFSNVMGRRILPHDMKNIGDELSRFSPFPKAGVLDYICQQKFLSVFKESFFEFSEISLEKITKETEEKHTDEENILDESIKKINKKNTLNYVGLVFIGVFSSIIWSLLLMKTTILKALVIAFVSTAFMLGIFLLRFLDLKKKKEESMKEYADVLNLHLKVNNIIGNMLKDIRNKKPVLEVFSYDKVVQDAQKQGHRTINEEKWYREEAEVS